MLKEDERGRVFSVRSLTDILWYGEDNDERNKTFYGRL